MSPVRMNTLGDFLCIPTLNIDKLNPLFHTFAEFRLLVNRVLARQSTDWFEANMQFSNNDTLGPANNQFIYNEPIPFLKINTSD